MKTLQKSKTLLACSIITALSGCGSESYTPEVKENLYAPEHGGNIVKTYSEKDGFEFLYALGAVDGSISGVGVATDMDGDILLVRNAVMPEDSRGVEPNGIKVGIRPTDLAPELDNGETHTVVLSYDVSDGELSIPRTMTIHIEGEDFPPEFGPLDASLTILEAEGVIDLLEGVTDADGEALTVTDLVASADNSVEAHTLDGNNLTIDIASFADTIPGGQSISLVYDYMVNDHNNSLPRTLTAVIKAVKAEPLPPEIISTYAGTFTNNDAPQIIDLGHPDYTVEWNGDPIIVHYDTIMPTDGGPALMFNKSSGTELVVDPVDFATYIEDGEVKTFNYSFQIGDGDQGESAGHIVETNFSVTITKEAAANLIENGSFEDGLTGWTADEAFVSVAASGDAWEGANELLATGWSELTTSTFAVSPGAAYHVYYAEQMSDWGRYNLRINGGEEDVIRSFGLHPTFAGAWTQYALRSKSFDLPVDALASTRSVTFETSLNKLDDVRVARFSTDNANNIVYANAGEAAVNFDDGSQGGWSSDNPENIEVTDLASDVISGSHSLVISGPAFIDLPVGTIKDDKKYLLKLDIKQLELNQGFGNVVMFQIHDAVDGSSFYANPLEHPRSIDLLAHPVGEVTTFEQIIDPSKVGQLSGWDTRSVRVQMNPTVWGAPGKVVIDNIQLIEID